MTARKRFSGARRGHAKSGHQNKTSMVSAAVLDYFADTIPAPRGETPDQKDARIARNRRAIRAYGPRDPFEAMMASQCIVFRYLFIDCALDYFDTADPVEREEIRQQGIELADLCREAHEQFPDWHKRPMAKSDPFDFASLGFPKSMLAITGDNVKLDLTDTPITALQHPAPKMLQ